jgi:hypothetical protein
MVHHTKGFNEKLENSLSSKSKTEQHTKVGRQATKHTKSDTVLSFVSPVVFLLGTGKESANPDRCCEVAKSNSEKWRTLKFFMTGC